MTGTAVTFLLIAATVIWGGLIASILRLRREGGAEDERPHDL